MTRDRKTVLPDVASSADVRLGLARVAVADLAVKAQLTLAARSQGATSYWPGARSPAGPARPPVDLAEVFEDRVDLVTKLGLRAEVRKDRVTLEGHRTARQRMPRALADADPGCRAAAQRYQHLAEKVAAVGSGETTLISGGTARASDGGAVHRTAIAAELRAMQACLVGMALARGNARGQRRDITVRALVDGVVLGGQEIKGVLRAHGWSGMSYVRPLTDTLHAALSGMATVKERY